MENEFCKVVGTLEKVRLKEPIEGDKVCLVIMISFLVNVMLRGEKVLLERFQGQRSEVKVVTGPINLKWCRHTF